ncbi:uncharacterized protein LOC115877859 [Sitophilus oryzae]|uniref:Uncharacterized protein LOC115877859 n=1 Tax=Sitophilus oryzae TaxID=7048 RepID=A0A6J2XGI9_SITOR|nr:uncharacterized protein LOC115877859 [Sitophilus oryzae]
MSSRSKRLVSIAKAMFTSEVNNEIPGALDRNLDLSGSDNVHDNAVALKNATGIETECQIKQRISPKTKSQNRIEESIVTGFPELDDFLIILAENLVYQETTTGVEQNIIVAQNVIIKDQTLEVLPEDGSTYFYNTDGTSFSTLEHDGNLVGSEKQDSLFHQDESTYF